MRSAALLALLLGLAAPALAQDQAGRAYYYEQIFEPFFTRRGSEYAATRPGATPGRFAARKPANGLRVFVIGGSIAQRYMSPHESGNLAAVLPALLPGREIEALDCGMSGYDSYRESLLVEEALEHQPDLIVLLTGHNEAIASPPVPLWTLHAADRLSRLGAFRALVARARRLGQHPPDAESALRRDRAFESNLRGMIRRAKAEGVPIAVASPPLDYRDAPSPVPLPFDEPSFVEGRLRHLRGDDAGALSSWAVIPRSDLRAPWLFYRAKLEDKAGRRAAAREDYVAALAADGIVGGRCGPRCQAIIRRVTREEGAIFVDLDGAFLRRARPRLPGLDMFQDNVHWKHSYDALVSATIVDVLRRSPGTAAWPWKDQAVSALRRRAAASGGDDSEDVLSTLRYALREMDRRDGALSLRALTFLERVLAREPGWFSSPKSLLARAAAQTDPRRIWTGQRADQPPPAVMLDLHWGELWLEHGDLARARAALEKAAASGEPPVAARLDLAAVDAWLGKRARAAASLRRLEAEERGRRRRASNYLRSLGLDASR